MATLGAQEMVVIFVVLLVLFGPKSLRQLGEDLAKALQQFRNQLTPSPIQLSFADLALLALLFVLLILVALRLSTQS